MAKWISALTFSCIEKSCVGSFCLLRAPLWTCFFVLLPRRTWRAHFSLQAFTFDDAHMKRPAFLSLKGRYTAWTDARQSHYSCTRKGTEPGYRHAGDNANLHETRGTGTQTNTNEAGPTVCRGVCDAEDIHGRNSTKCPSQTKGNQTFFDTRERMGEQLLRPCRALAQTQTHALATATICSIVSDHDSSHSSQGTWLRPRSPKTVRVTQGEKRNYRARKFLNQHSQSLNQPSSTTISALAQSLLFTLVFIVDPPGDPGDLRPTFHIRWTQDVQKLVGHRF